MNWKLTSWDKESLLVKVNQSFETPEKKIVAARIRIGHTRVSRCRIYHAKKC